jgi:hypothetical protein
MGMIRMGCFTELRITDDIIAFAGGSAVMVTKMHP